VRKILVRLSTSLRSWLEISLRHVRKKEILTGWMENVALMVGCDVLLLLTNASERKQSKYRLANDEMS